MLKNKRKKMWNYNFEKDYSYFYNKPVKIESIRKNLIISGLLESILGPSLDIHKTGTVIVSSFHSVHRHSITTDLIESIIVDDSEEMKEKLEVVESCFSTKLNDDIYYEIKKHLLPNYVNI